MFGLFKQKQELSPIPKLENRVAIGISLAHEKFLADGLDLATEIEKESILLVVADSLVTFKPEIAMCLRFRGIDPGYLPEDAMTGILTIVDLEDYGAQSMVRNPQKRMLAPYVENKILHIKELIEWANTHAENLAAAKEIDRIGFFK